MSNFILGYIDRINHLYQLGNATEHTFRGDLAQLIHSLVPDITATNEPKRQSCGAPDYILTKKTIPIGFIEAKDKTLVFALIVNNPNGTSKEVVKKMEEFLLNVSK